METSRHGESNRAHKMMVAAVDFISDHVNRAWASLNVAKQELCNMFRGVTLDYEGHPCVPFLSSYCFALCCTPYFTPVPSLLLLFTERLLGGKDSTSWHCRDDQEKALFPVETLACGEPGWCVERSIQTCGSPATPEFGSS